MAKVINFGTKVFYMDPDYSSLDIMIQGTVGVEAPGREDDPSFEQIVRNTVSQTVMAKSQELAGMKVPYKMLQAHNSDYSEAAANQLSSEGITVTSLSIANAAPTEDSRKHIAEVDKIKSFSNLTQDDLEEMRRKAEEARLAYLASTGQKNMAGQGVGLTGAPAPAAQAAAVAAAVGPKFCTECGSPVNGAKFCQNCGKKLV